MAIHGISCFVLSLEWCMRAASYSVITAIMVCPFSIGVAFYLRTLLVKPLLTKLTKNREWKSCAYIMICRYNIPTSWLFCFIRTLCAIYNKPCVYNEYGFSTDKITCTTNKSALGSNSHVICPTETFPEVIHTYSVPLRVSIKLTQK